MFIGHIFFICILIFTLVQITMWFLLLRNWLASWPAVWWFSYKYLFLFSLLFVLSFNYSVGYLGKLDFFLILIVIFVFYNSSFMRMVFAFLLHFLGKFARFWWNKLKIYNYRYYFFSLNVVITESDLFWLEIHRDQLYPNDDRYFRIYRRWVFWMSPRPLEEANDYFYLFILGYLARQFIIITRLACIYGRIYVQKVVANLFGTTFSHTLFFGMYFIFFYSLRKVSSIIHKFAWITYIFLLRQFQYIGGSFVNFHILDELNVSWAQSEVPGNYDAFDEIIYGYPRDPSSFIVKVFEYLKSWDCLGEQNGLNFMVLASCYKRYWRYAFSFFIFMPFMVLYNIICMAMFHLIIIYDKGYCFYHLAARKSIAAKISLLQLARSNSLASFLLLFLANSFYHILLLPLLLLRDYLCENTVKITCYGISILFYKLVMLLSFMSYLPVFFFYALKAFIKLIFFFRIVLLTVLLIIIFSDQQLYFMYIFSFGWVFSIVFCHLDSLHLFRPEEYISLRISYRFVASAMPTYPVEFFKTLYYYKIYVWRKISDVYRVRSAWYTLTSKWLVWIYFMRFMPFYGQTSMIQKWWFNAVYYFLLRTPVLFWWTYASYDSFYGAMWALASLLKISIFWPYSFLKGFIYGVAGGSRPLYTSGYYICFFLKVFFTALRDYLIWPIYISLKYIAHLLGSALYLFCAILVNLLVKVFGFLGKTLFKASWVYGLCVSLSLTDPFFLGSWKWLFYTIYGDIFYYLPRLGSMGFLKLTFLLELAESYRGERLTELYSSGEAFLWKWANNYWVSLEEIRKTAVLANPMFFFMASMLEAQKLLDILSINLQFPRDVQRNVYDYLVKKNLNFRFLRWVMYMRRTEMYSTARWYMPLMTYFSLMSYISFYGDGLHDFIGFSTLTLLRQWLPSFFFGFMWNTIFIYYFLLMLLILVFPGFFCLTFNQGLTGDHINREYNWHRFLNQGPKELAWLFPTINRVDDFAEHVAFTNAMDTKLIYYEKLLARSIAFPAIKYSLDDLMDDSFVELDCAKEETNFVIPTFLDFYLATQYPNFRSAINKGEEPFLYFSALAYARDEWIRTLWERTEDDDYTPIGPEILFDQINLDAYISFLARWQEIQRKTDAYLFNNSLASWSFSKDPYSFQIIRTSVREDFMDDKFAQYFSKLSDEYEYEDDSDITYIAWGLWGWLIAIPAMLFYQAFFFLGGSHWHYNRFSSGILHPFMLYFTAVLNHFEWARLTADIAGDTYPNVKRESSFIGNHQMMQYRPTSIHSVLRTSFYDYKLTEDSFFGEDCQWFWGRLFYYRCEYLSFSALDVVRLINIFSFLLILIFLPFIFTQRWNWRLKKASEFFSLNNHVFTQKWFSMRKNFKKLYLWFYR